jgi:nitrogen fixation protein FixH
VRWLCLLLAVLLASCSVPAGSAEVRGQGWTATLEWSPQRPKALQPARLVLRVRDPAGRPLPVEALEARADMPEMSHDPDPLPFQRTAEGTYEATHNFSMDGLWRVRVTGRVPGSRLEANFELTVGSP